MSGASQPSSAPEAERSVVTVLDQASWRDLQGSVDDEAFAAAWLRLTCGFVPGAFAAALFLADPGGGLRVASVWPAGAALSPQLAEAVKAATGAGRAAVQPPPAGTASSSIAAPILIDGALAGVAAVDVTLPPPARDPRVALRHLQWAIAWVRERLRADESARSGEIRARPEAAMDLIAAVLEQPDAGAATRAAATELAGKLACERVSVGFVRGGRCRVASISHSAAFGERLTLTTAIEAAMDEAIDQFTLVLVPPPDDAVLVTAAHARLAGMHAPATVLTIPLLAREEPIGALTFERPLGQPFTARDVGLAEAVAATLGPALADKRLAGRWLVLRAADSGRASLAGLVGPAHLGRKLGVAAAVLLVAAAWLVRADYNVHARARVTGTVQRAITAPFDGFIREAPVRAGDEVAQGALLVALDDRDLVLERLRWSTERQVHLAEYDRAMGGAKRADVVRLQSEVDQADARIRLVDEQLAHTRLVSPFDGLVVSGELSQSVGAPVRRGDVLLEIAPIDDYEVELQVPEGQIADVAPGERGSLVVNALPHAALPLIVVRTTPVADAKDGQMTFRADAALGERDARLRPGMEGVAKIGAGRARLVWIWTRSLQQWVRLATWSWLP